MTELFNTQGNKQSSSEILAEIICCVKESNKTTRKEASKLLTDICDKSVEHYEDPSNFMQFILAGLAGTTPQMISATVISLTVLLKHLHGIPFTTYFHPSFFI